MGNENSKSDEERRQYARQQGVSRDEVNRLLEQQRREYERKLQELKVRKAPTPNANKPTNMAREATEVNDSNIDQIIAQQLKDFVQIAYNNSSPSSNTGTQRSPPPVKPTPVSSTTGESSMQNPIPATRRHIFGPSGEGTSTATASIERNRSPYNFTREDLQNRQSQMSPRNNLYPNLETNANYGQSCDQFVFVERNKYAQGSPTQPSAPPLPTGAISKNSNSPKPSPFRPRPAKNEDEAMNCISCGKKFGLNIFQCSKGHSSCRDCKLNHVPCGICRGPIGETRNITLETYISERKAPCSNSSDGCTLLLKIADMEAHLKECPYREFVCPLFEIFGQRELCKWRGKLSQMVSHFDDVHPAHRQANIDTEMVLINILDNMHVVHLIDMFPYVFLVHLKVSDQERKIYMTVQLMGTQISASKWSYELHVYNKREPRRKFQHTDVCNSHVVPLEEIFGESKCAVIPQSYALTYVNEGCLNYKFFIKREFDPAPSTSRGKWRGGGRGRGRGRGARAN